MDIDRLRYFVVLSASDTMREAAEHLHISQPALSKAIKLLEQELGEQLFAASGRRILITDRGRLIAEKTKRILLDLEQLTKADVGQASKPLRIGSFEVFTTYFMGELAATHLTDFNIEVRELIPGHLEEQIARGGVDFGITYLPIPKQELDFIKVASIGMGVYGLIGFEKVEFKSLPFVVPITPVQGAPDKVKGLDGWPDDKFPRSIKYQVELMETALALCRQGLAVAYLPSFVVELHNEQVKQNYLLKNIQASNGLKRNKQDVYLIKRKSQQESPVFREVAKALRKLR